MRRSGQPQYGVVMPTGMLDLRGMAGGTISGVTAQGSATVLHKVNGRWDTLTSGGSAVTIDITVGGAEIIPDAMFHAGIVRLDGISGTVDLEPKS